MFITEAYRTLELQQHYWNTLPFPMAATPGTSTHGWALAIDMANYQSVPRDALRALGQSYGFSFATGDRVAEPWHIEYVGSLHLADVDEVTPIVTPEPEEDMIWLKHDSHEVWFLIAPGVATQRIRDHAEARLISQVLMKGKSAERATSAQLTALIARCEASIPARAGMDHRAIASAVAEELRADLRAVPASVVDELRGRLS